ncbi:MAG: AAA family ATPase [Deltaproteobacteria bacterium]|nr:AAA family ATPase [Deltaproteobacteria bacterium]
MECPKCQTENPNTRRFCRECGAKLVLYCPHCSSENQPGDKFCGECGHGLTQTEEPAPKDLSFDEKLDKIQRYLPEGLTEKILSQRDRIEGERKQVTVMFCDMAGFTSLVEKLGPEEAYTVMDQVYEILIHKVHDYEGTVNEMTGDGIMALFGAPIALEDAPQRAIRSALAIHREMVKFNEKMKEDKTEIPPLKMRIGIHTGPVVVGTMGNDLRVEFKAVGDTVNLASRMEGMAEPGTTYVTEDTFKLTEGFFRFESLGRKQVRGKEEPIQAHKVLEVSTRRTRFDVSAARGLTPFVGRQRELESLLDGLERVKTGHGQAFFIVSEAGLGKSRLLHEFRKAIGTEDVTFLEGKCVSYGRGLSYHPIVEMLKSNFDIQEEDGDATIQQKVRSGLISLGADESAILPYILGLLSVKDSGVDKIVMSPQGKRDQNTEALKQIVLRGSQIRPLVLAVEDLHWVDRSSEDVLKSLLPSIPGAKVFLLFTYRPEYEPTWRVKSYQSQITLNRLSNRESLQMAEYLLKSKEISSSAEQVILEKTEGIPFFVEEFVKSFKNLNIIEKDGSVYHLSGDASSMKIPTTIHDVIMARVDALSETAKNVLQIASVIEREFSSELMKRVAGFQEKELLASLSALKEAELILERGVPPHSTYVLKHALTRDVVNDSILARRKNELHNKIGSAIENIYQNNLDVHYGFVANHFLEAENYIKAAQYSKLAAKKALKAGALKDAIGYGEKLALSLERLPRTQDVEKKIIDARTALGLYYNQANIFVLSKEAVEPVISLAAKHDYRRRIGQINTILGAYVYAVEEDFPKAEDQFREAISDAEATGDLISLVMAHHWMGHVLADNCQFEQSLYHLNKALEISTMANVLWGIAAQTSCIARTVYLYQGKVNVGYPMSCEGLEKAEESGDAYSKIEAHFSMGMAYYQKRRLKNAKEHLSMSCELCERIESPALHSDAEWCLGETYFSMKEYEECKKHFGNAVRLLISYAFMPSFMRVCELAMARVMAFNEEKIPNLDVLLAYGDKKSVRRFSGQIRRLLAEIILYSNDNDMGKADKFIQEAVTTDKQNGNFFDLPIDLAVYAQIHKKSGERSRAREALREAIGICEECGRDGWAEKYENELASL